MEHYLSDNDIEYVLTEGFISGIMMVWSLNQMVCKCYIVVNNG